jgi:hypothetical protein
MLMECFYLALIVINMANSASKVYSTGVAVVYVLFVMIPPLLVMFSLAPRVTKVERLTTIFSSPWVLDKE